MIAELFAQESPPANILELFDALGSLLILGFFILTAFRGDLRLGREVTGVEERLTAERALRLNLEAQLAEERERSAAEIATVWAAYRDQCAAREAAERALQNALQSGRITEALLDALNQAREGKR